MKLLSLNVEGSKHWALITPFLEKELPDVACFQEIFACDAARIAERLGMHYAFSPMTLRHYDFFDPRSRLEPFGVAMLSKLPMANVNAQDYHATPGAAIHAYDDSDTAARRASIRQTMLSAEIACEAEPFVIATTHFTWTPDGMPDQSQEEDARALLEVLERSPELVLCGDFNIPRGINPLYEAFAGKYRDAIPPAYASSIYLPLHRKEGDPESFERLSKFMVDYLFLAEGYSAEDVSLHSGVSDHYAVTAILHRSR